MGRDGFIARGYQADSVVAGEAVAAMWWKEEIAGDNFSTTDISWHCNLGEVYNFDDCLSSANFLGTSLELCDKLDNCSTLSNSSNIDSRVCVSLVVGYPFTKFHDILIG